PNRGRTSAFTSGEMADFIQRGGEPAEPARARSGDAARDHSAELGEHPLTISVRPIDAEPRATPDAAPVYRDAAPPAAPNPGPPATIVAAPADGSGAREIAPVAPDDDDERTVVTSSPRAPRSTEDRAIQLWAGAAVFGVVVVVTAAVVLLGWLAMQRYRRAQATGVAASAAGATVTDEGRQTASAKIAEADRLLAAGRADEAVARLREAAAADPSNAEPHRRLARLLLEGGARRTAIEELKAVVRLDASDAAAWRSLADAQAAEGLHADAAGSYHSLLGVAPEATRDDSLQLAYADALRLSGQTSQAQSLYKRLASSRDARVARASREQLSAAEGGGARNANAAANANLPRASEAASSNSSNAAAQTERERIEAARAAGANRNSAAAPATATALPAAASPKEHFERGSQLWRANRAAAIAEFAAAARGGNSDANYYLGLNLAEGRDPRSLKRGELIAALSYFQRARRGRFGAEARRYEDSLGKEFDRRRASGQN
ncbi:MAG: tetratricopeptide repeat protein, partial [Acidobacteria bacterium]|nr:tetratricopeptide repeat protein [Acidobacteriota bacterium]